jgi:hypothetical protein
VPADLERDLVHDAEDVPAGRLGEPDFSWFEAAARVDRKQIADAKLGDEEREERPGVHDQQGLAPLAPEQVRIPVVAVCRRLDESDRVFAKAG